MSYRRIVSNKYGVPEARGSVPKNEIPSCPLRERNFVLESVEPLRTLGYWGLTSRTKSIDSLYTVERV